MLAGLPGSVIADRFEIVQAVRKGGMSQVFRALDRTTNRIVALKVLGDGWQHEAERFLREALALERLRHPGIVRYVAHGAVNAPAKGGHYLAMEWLDGEDLAVRLEKGGRLSLADSVALAARVSSALAIAHEQGLVHRDIKPSNLFLPDGKPDRVKVIDFGIARFADRADLTGPGIIFGTAGYMAPEQARGERRIDARADVFALGCVLFECITGKPVFAGAHATAVLAKVVLEDAPRLRTILPNVPDALDRLVSRLLSKVPASRPSDARALSQELEAIARAGLEEAAPTSLRPESLTEHEQRLVCVVMTAGIEARMPDQTIALKTLEDGPGPSRFDAIRAAVAPFGAQLEYLRNGSLIATLTGKGNASDLATNAARCALSIRALEPDASIVVALGRGILGARVPVGAAIDLAVEMLRATPSVPPRPSPAGTSPDARSGAPIRVDAMTAALLDARFEIGREPEGFLLRAEREVVESTRTLLGKPTPCVGRERELGFLKLLLDESIKDRAARAVLVTAPAGMGKSRVRHEVLRGIRERTDVAPEVWIARGDPMSAGSPFGMVAQIVRRAVGMRDGEPLEVRRQKIIARVEGRVPQKRALRVAQFLGELANARFDDEASLQLRAARQDAMLMGDQMRAAWEDFIDAEAATHPVVVVLEDLHWGDLPSVQFIDAALRTVRDRPFFVFALARPEVHELFPSLWSARGVHEIRLGELGKKASEKLVREVLGDTPSDAVVARLVERSSGNAFYLEELIRVAAEAQSAGRSIEEQLPETVVAMVQARLERLEPDARRVLRAASVFGQVFWPSGLAALLGEGHDERRLAEWLAELVSREMISRRSEGKFPGEDEYLFHHAMVREAAYAMLTDGDRKLGHLIAGKWLEHAGESDAMTLAEHFERGGEHAKAIGWYRKAAEHALEGNDFEAVVARAERAVVCGAQGEILGGLRVLQAEAHRWRGDLAGAEACALDAMRLLPRCTPPWFSAVSDLALASGRRGKGDQLAALAQMLQELGEDRDVTGPHAMASARAATQLLLAGNKQEVAEALIAQLDRIPRAEQEKNPAVTARVAVARFYHAICGGDVGAGSEFAKTAIARFEAVGDLRNACVQRGDFAYTQVELGAYGPATDTLREVLALSERLGRLQYATLAAKQNLGIALARRGSLEEARTIEEEALAEFEAKGDRRMAGGSRIHLAEIRLLAGDHDGAKKEARAAIEMLATVPAVRAHAYAMLASIELARGRQAEALAAAKLANDFLENGGVLDEGEGLVRLAFAEALWANEMVVDARTAIGTARRRLVERSLRIRDEQLRRSFLERVPENARTLELALQWGGHTPAPRSA